MKEFYFIYYLVLLAIYLLLPVVLRLLPVRKETRLTHYKKELRGHLTVSIVLSAIVLSFLPWPLVTIQETHGADQFAAGVFALALIGTAGFFIWIGVKQAGVNRRALREEQEKLKKDQTDPNL